MELRDLLPDNISLLNQLNTVTPIPTGASRPRLREVTSLASWAYCFLAYVALSTSDPETRDRLAYARLIIRESQRHGGTRWLDYDRGFRQQIAIDASLPWNTLHPGLHAATVLAKTSQVQSCSICREPDHLAAHCALAYLQQQTTTQAAFYQDAFRPSKQPRPRPRPETLAAICVSWNKGRCAYPGSCSYRHICATCHQGHKSWECKDTPPDSEYKFRRDTAPAGSK